MLPGPDRIIECPNCSSLLCMSTLASGNTFGATQWTDGKMEAPMLPDSPEITTCQDCQRFFWIKDARVAGEYDWYHAKGEKPEEWKQAPSITYLDAAGFAEALDQGLGTSQSREKHLRIQLWWAMNDPIRRGEQADIAPGQKELFRENLELLFDLLQDSDPAGHIMRLEAAREMGDFDRCIVRLTVIPEKYKWVCDQIRQLVQLKNQIVCELQPQ